MEAVESGGQRTEVTGRRAEGGDQTTDDGGPRGEWGRNKNRWPMTDKERRWYLEMGAGISTYLLKLHHVCT